MITRGFRHRASEKYNAVAQLRRYDNTLVSARCTLQSTISQRMNRLTMTLPDDWHTHLRDADALATTVPAATRCFGRCIIMPNLVPPVTSVALALNYRQRILRHQPVNSDWQPLMVLYLTDNTSAAEIRAAHAMGLIQAVKYYPAGATTHSAAGVTNLERLDSVFATLQELGMVLQMHGEVTDPDIDIFDREAVFIDRHLTRITERFPALKIVLEHITTHQGVDFVRHSHSKVAATITPQHLLYNRNDMLVGGIRPHLYCLPILKRNRHQEALIDAATSGSHKFFLGTDSAPHAREDKESYCGCAGCYSHHAAIELYAEAFDRAESLHQLEGFASHHGADFYGLSRNPRQIHLIRKSWQVPEKIHYRGTEIVPLAAGETLHWTLES